MLCDMMVSARWLLLRSMSRDGDGLPSLTTWDSKIFAGFACGEDSAAEKDPCSEAQLVRPIGLRINGMCCCARLIAGLCRVGGGKCKAKQVRKEVRASWHDLTVCARPVIRCRAGNLPWPSTRQVQGGYAKEGAPVPYRLPLIGIASPAIQ